MQGTKAKSGGAVMKISAMALSCLITVFYITVVHPHTQHWSEMSSVVSKNLANDASLMKKLGGRHLQYQTFASTRHLTAVVPPYQLDPNGKVGTDFPLKKNQHFYADYNVSAVTVPSGEGYEYDLTNPAVRRDMKFEYIDPQTSMYHVETLSYAPRVHFIKNFMTHEECDRIRAIAEPRMRRSEVAVYKGGHDDSPVSNVRTSSQTWLNPNDSSEDPVVSRIVNRILNLTGFAAGQAEMLQILRYQIGQKYDSHMDYFDPQLYGKQASNRAVTVYLYFSDVEEGGETHFPRAHHKPPTGNMRCNNQGLKVRPFKGGAAVFYGMKPNGEFDSHSLHGGCPVVKGTKIGGTLWLRIPTP